MATETSQTRGHDTVLDVTAEQLASVYAKGFLAAAQQAGGMEGAKVALDELRAVDEEVFAQFPKLAEAARSAFLSHEERVGVLDRVLGGRVSPVVLNTLKVLSSHERFGLLRQVVGQSQLLLDRDNGRVHVRVTTAQRLDQPLLDELAGVLRQKLGVEPILEPEIDDDMIAGIKIRVKDTVYDGSLKTIFAKAKQSIIEHAIERIERDPTHFLSDEGFLAQDSGEGDGNESTEPAG